jgi:hypothetical protein
MTDNITFMETDELDNKIQIIMRQSNYTYEESKQKLQDYQYNEIKVIRAFMGIPEKKETPVKSINQEIYRQLRYRLDASMSEYNKKKECEQQN